MTQEEKYLLLKDLCARLPYGVKCQPVCGGEARTLVSIAVDRRYCCELDRGDYMPSPYMLEDIKPYLRPMSSMTEEEAITIFKIIYGDDTEFSSVEVSDDCIEIWDYDYNEDGCSKETVTIYFGEIVHSIEVLDYLLSRYFDIPRWYESENAYKTMIEKGLAIEVTEENNPYKE